MSTSPRKSLSIKQKQQLLNNAVARLKSEFIGLDKIIDQIAEAIGPWYFTPKMQERPTVINLWGMTGVGKTSLVTRMFTLLRLEEKFLHFNMGRDDNQWSIKRQFNELFHVMHGKPLVLVLDEFQHCGMKEGGEQENPIIWPLLDSGFINIAKYPYNAVMVSDLAGALESLLADGVKVKNGVVVKGNSIFLREFASQHDVNTRTTFRRRQKVRPAAVNYFVPNTDISDIQACCKDRFPGRQQLVQHLRTLDGPQTIRFIKEAYGQAFVPRLIDCTKVLVFVIGNLDEAYAMSNSYNPDTSADIFHEQSLKITVPDIKKTLRLHFRNEQISRLGNTHIIYPAFSSKSFKRIITLELDRLAKKFTKLHGIGLLFDKSVHQLVYDEGVYPAQGCRPLISTVHELIAPQLSKTIIEAASLNAQPDEVCFSVTHAVIASTEPAPSIPRGSNPADNGSSSHTELPDSPKTICYTMRITLMRRGKVIHRFATELKLSLTRQRESNMNDAQAVTAVHEAGHAVLAAVLMKVMPNSIRSRTAASGSGGGVGIKKPWTFDSKKRLLNEIAMGLGGIAAEKLVFGEDNVTMGVQNDLREVTATAARMIRQCGMGALPAATNLRYLNPIGVLAIDALHDESTDNNAQIEALLKSGMALAEKTLKEQERLLLQVADYLSDNSEMPKEIFRELLSEYAVDFHVSSLIEDGELLFYRKKLKERVEHVHGNGNVTRVEGNGKFVG